MYVGPEVSGRTSPSARSKAAAEERKKGGGWGCVRDEWIGLIDIPKFYLFQFVHIASCTPETD